jgi:hypothetical protein
MSKTAYISPATGELEIDVIRDATPRVVINLDLGIPNFTVFSLKFPLVTEEPKNMAVVTQEALGILLDEVATFMISLKFDQKVITDVYARALSCFAGMSMESSTQSDYTEAGQDPTMDTYKGTFVLPMSFVQETQKRVVTGASFVKRVPKQRVMEFVKAVPVNKNTINDAQRTIQMYKNRQLKTQPKPLYVLVYDMNGNPTGVLPVDQQWKNKLLRKIQSWQKSADDDDEGGIKTQVVDVEYNGKGVDTAGTQVFTGVRPQIPADNPGVAGTSTASGAQTASTSDDIAAVLGVLKAGPKLPQEVSKSLGWPHEKAYGTLQELRNTGVVGVNKMRYFISGTLGKTSAKAEANGAIGKEVYDAMEKRCFNLESEKEGSAVYERHDGDIRIVVNFRGQEIGDVKLGLTGEEAGRWSNDSNSHKKHGWEGIKSFTNTYGD